MTPTQERDRIHSLDEHPQFLSMSKRLQDWIGSSPNATASFSDFFRNGGKFEPVNGVGLPYYNPTSPPTIIVDQAQWELSKDPQASEHPQRHLFATLAHEIGHDRYNTGNVLFEGGSADDYVRYRAGLEAQAIFTAFPIFKDLENEPAFKQEFPFNSIGYLNGIELALMYKQWRSGEQSDQAIVERIAAKVPDTRYSLGNPPPDLDQDGAVTHRDAYLRDYQQLIRQRPELAQAEPQSVQTAVSAGMSEADRAMLQQIETGTLKALQSGGKPHDPQTLERIGHALLAACKHSHDRYPDAPGYAYAANALNRVDHIVLGQDGRTLFAVEGRLDDPAHKRALVDVAQAAQTPPEQSDRKLEAANQRILAEQSHAQRATPAQSVEQTAPSAMAH